MYVDRMDDGPYAKDVLDAEHRLRLRCKQSLGPMMTPGMSDHVAAFTEDVAA